MTLDMLARNAIPSELLESESIVSMLPSGDFSFFDEDSVEEAVMPPLHHRMITADDVQPSVTVVVRHGSLNASDKIASRQSTNWGGWRLAKGIIIDLPPRKSRMEALALEWINDTQWDSSFSRIMQHPSFKKLVASGKPALSYAIARIRDGDLQVHWFLIAKSISGVDPVPPEARGRLARMAEYWLDWYDHRVVDDE